MARHRTRTSRLKSLRHQKMTREQSHLKKPVWKRKSHQKSPRHQKMARDQKMARRWTRTSSLKSPRHQQKKKHHEQITERRGSHGSLIYCQITGHSAAKTYFCEPRFS